MSFLGARIHRPGFAPMLSGVQNPLDVPNLTVLDVDTFMVFDTPDISIRFNLHQNIVFHDDQFFAAWTQGTDEGTSLNHVVWSTSSDGETWNSPVTLNSPGPETGWLEGAIGFWQRQGEIWLVYSYGEVGDHSEGENYYGINMSIYGRRWNGSSWDATQLILTDCMLDKEPILLNTGKYYATGRNKHFDTQMILGDLIDVEAFAPYEKWDFASGVEGWAAANGTITANGGVLQLNSSSNDSYVLGPTGLGLGGLTNPIVQMRVRRTTGTGSLAQLQLYFYNELGLQTPPVTSVSPADPSEWNIIEWDLSGNAQWTEHTIDRIRIDIGTTGDVIEIDWIAIGAYSNGNWQRIIVPSPSGVLLNEATILPIGNGSVISYEYRNEETMTPRELLRSFSFDNGVTISAPVVTNFPDAKSRRAVQRLSDGRYVLCSNASDEYVRRKLMLSVSDDGYTYDRTYILRGEETHPKYGWTEGNPPLPREGYQYPQMMEKDGYLWVIVSRNKEDIQLTRVALSAFT